MISPDTQQVFTLSDFFHVMGNAVRDYIDKNKNSLGDDERNYLFDFQINLLQQAADINMLGTAMVFDNVSQTISQLSDISISLKKAEKKAQSVQKVINIATSVVELGTSILSRNPKEIVAKTVAAFNALKG